MEATTKAALRMGKKVAVELTSGQTVPVFAENGPMMKWKEKDSFSGLMVAALKGTSKMGICTAREFTLGAMVVVMKAATPKIRNTALALTFTLTAVSTKETGSMVSSTAKVQLPTLMVNFNGGESGSMVNCKNGLKMQRQSESSLNKMIEILTH